MVNDLTSSSQLAFIAILVLALLSAVAPLATDMYLPGFPEMATDLDAGAAAVQFTLTSFLLGLAIGQLVIGPLSDRFGRRRPLLIGTGVAVVSGLMCVLAPNVQTLVILRLVQGLGGSAGIVLARAVISDRAPNANVAARLFQLMMMIGGLAPVLAPVLGAGIVAIAGWRAVMAVIALLSVLSFFGAIRFIDETLPAEKRTPSGLGAFLTAIWCVLSNRRYMGYALTAAFAFMAMFAYIAASPFVYQKVLDLSPVAYSIAFGLNAIGLVGAGGISAKLVGRVAPQRLTAVSLTIMLVTTLLLLTATIAGSDGLVMLPLIFISVASAGPIFGNASALAISESPGSAGTASAVLGALQFCLGAVASPLVGMGGESNAFPMALVMVIAALLAIVSFAVLARNGRK